MVNHNLEATISNTINRDDGQPTVDVFDGPWERPMVSYFLQVLHIVYNPHRHIYSLSLSPPLIFFYTFRLTVMEEQDMRSCLTSLTLCSVSLSMASMFTHVANASETGARPTSTASVLICQREEP